MCADHAAATTSGTTSRRAGALSKAPIDPWLRMRLTPARGALKSATVRDALRAIASTRPDAARLTLELQSVRALLDGQRAALRRRLRDGVSGDVIAGAKARLLDGAVIGLCHLGRLAEPRPAGMVPPLAVIACGAYGRRQLDPKACPELLFLVAADPRRRDHGLAVAEFVARGLAGLGWQTSSTERTVQGRLAEARLDPRVGADLAAARLVWGCHGLFAELQAGVTRVLSESDDRSAVPAPERMLGHAA